MRFFIAVDIPQTSKDQIKKVGDSIKQLIPESRLTESDKLHITIAFIGEQSDVLKARFVELINSSVIGIKPFNLTPSYIDGFPSIHDPHTLWVGLKGDVDKLFILTERIKDGLVKMNLDVDERRFVPHIAIAKTRNYHLSDSIEQQLQVLISQPLNIITVSSIKLFESESDEGFHKHNTLAEINLT